MRNVSQPTATVVGLHFKDYLTLALTSSAAFGRYVVAEESLNREEKCSSFSPNKYSEKAEKISRPGSVAELKAYFESYYNKIGPKEIVAAPSLVVQPRTGDSNNNNEGLASEGTRKAIHDLNINAEGIHELVKTEPIVYKVTHDLNINAEESHELVKTEPIVDKEIRNVNQLVKAEPTVEEARKSNEIPFMKRKEITLVTRPQIISTKDDAAEQKSPSSSREKKKGNINSPKSNSSSINGRSSNPQPRQMAVNSTPIAAKEDTPLRRTTTTFVGSKKPVSSFSGEAAVGSHNKQRSPQQGSKLKSRSFDASLRRPWR